MANGLRPFALPRSHAAGWFLVQISGIGAYIRKQIPIRAPAGLSRVQSQPLPGRARISYPPARPDLFHPTSGKRDSANFAKTEFSEVRFEGPQRLVERWRLRLEYRL
jgi:hypothetical protein